MARSNRDVCEAMAVKWDGLAYELEKLAKSREFSVKERERLELRATERRACAQELRLEGQKFYRDR